MKHFYVYLLLLPFIFLSTVFADIIPGGNVSGTWTVSNQPYYIQGNITVPNGQTLTIQPGVEVRFRGDYVLAVEGVMNAIGTATDSIIFVKDSVQHDYWGGIKFLYTDDVCTMAYCLVQESRADSAFPDTSGGAIRIIGSSPHIQNCTLQSNGASLHGGAIYVGLSSSSPIIEDCVIQDNIGLSSGGAIAVDEATPTIRNNYFYHNGASQGGGIFISGVTAGPINIEGNTFETNEAGVEYGGGVYVYYCGSKITITRNMFYGNLAVLGGGIYCVGGFDVDITNNLIFNNVASAYGGGIGMNMPGKPNIFNNTIYNNTASQGGGFGSLPLAGAVIKNNVFWANTGTTSDPQIFGTIDSLTIEYCDVQGTLFAGTGNINDDPLFLDAGNADFHIDENSPLLEAGTDDGAPTIDFDGNTRPIDGDGIAPAVTDIGAFEFDPMFVAPIITGQAIALLTPEETALEITLAAVEVTDPDNTFPDDFTLTVQDGTNYTHVGNIITPATNFNGDLTVPVVVNDGISDSNIFDLTVTVTPVNDVPQITGQAQTLSTAEETSLGITLAAVTVTDPDDTFPADFTLSVQSGTNYTFVGNTITPATDFNGDLTVNVTVNDGDDDSNVFGLTVSVTPVNDAPTITAQAQTLTTPEETALAITLAAVTVTDPDNNFPADFTLSVQDGSDYTHAGNTITPADNFNGDLTVPVIVNDGEDDSNTYNLTVSVSPINDPPQITGQATTLSTLEETNLTITLSDISVTDIDNTYPDDFTLHVQDGTDYTHTGNTITPATDFNGDLTVPVLVNDGSDDSNIFDLTVSVTPVNDVPSITGQSTIETPEETAVAITLDDLTVTDVDNTYPDDFTLSVGDGLNYTHVGNTITPATNFNGDLTVPVTVNDGSDDSNTYDLIVSVTPVNDVPQITGQSSLVTPEETALTIVLENLTVTDPDNTYPDDFTLTVGDGENYTHVGNTITPATDYNGDLTVPVTVNDGSDDSAPFDLTVSVTPVSDVPVITGQEVLTTPEETELTITLDDLNVTDVDNTYPDDFTLFVQDGSNYTRSGNSITPITDFNGNLTVPVYVNDGTNNSNTYNLIVSVTAVNDAPVITGQNPLSTPEETALTIVLTNLIVTDVDNTYPTGFTLTIQDGSNYTRSGNTITPVENFNGDLTVPVVVNDGLANSNTYNLTVSVTGVNDIPQITGQSTLTTNEETALTITLSDITVVDNDNTYPDDFTLTVRDGANYTRTDNTITPIANFNGDLAVPVVVNDGTNDSEEYSLVVTVEGVNDPPVFAVSRQFVTFNEDDSLTYTLMELSEWVDDPDNPDTALVFTSEGSEFLSVNIDSPMVILKADANWYGTDSVEIYVSDGELMDTTLIVVHVNSINDLPVITGVPDSVTFVNSANLVITMNDWVVDNDLPQDSLRWEISVSNSALQYDFDPQTSNLTLTSPDFYGEVMLRFTVSDDSAANATDSVRVVIEGDPLSIDGGELEIPVRYELSQNYPNPFNPETTIKFGLPKAGQVVIYVFNILGQKVDTILDDFRSAGYHTLTYNASHLSSGIYFYAIQTQEFSQVKKMVLLK